MDTNNKIWVFVWEPTEDRNCGSDAFATFTDVREAFRHFTMAQWPDRIIQYDVEDATQVIVMGPHEFSGKIWASEAGARS